MKPIHATLLLMAGLLVLINSPLRAQEKPDAPPPPEAAARPERPAPPGEPPAQPPGPRGERARGPQSRAAEEKAVPFIGVLTTGVSPDLRAQFNLQDGFGLQVVEVMPDTPAQAAGLKEHDILLTFEDQKLVNMEQLQTLVRSKKKDDQVNFNIISGGKQSQITIKVGERMMPVNPDEGRNRGGRFFQMPPRSYGYERPDNYNRFGREPEETLERVRDFLKRLNEWSHNRTGDMPTPPTLDNPRRREGSDSRPDERNGGGPSRYGERRESQQNGGTISRRDDSGEYRLKREDDRTVFTVHPKDGEEQSWNVNNDADRQAVPEQFREKLKMLEDIRKDMHRDGGPGHGPKDGDRRPAPDSKPRDNPPPPGNAGSKPGGTI